MGAVEFYVVRHGETLLNKLGKTQGLIDSPLTLDGINTAKKLSRTLLPLNFSAIYCSDLPRAQRTAEILGEDKLPIIPDYRLREWSLGIFEAESNKKFIQTLRESSAILRQQTNIDSRLDEVVNAIHRLDTTGFTEKFDVICQRLQNFLQQIGNEHLQKGGGRVIVVTHACIMKTLMYIFAYDKLLEKIKIGHENMEIITYDGRDFSLKFE